MLHTFIDTILAIDLSLLQSALHLVPPQYARIVQISGELVVLYGACLLIGFWLYGVYRRDDLYKRISLAIFLTIVSVFVLYAIINLGLPKWRPGATEMAGSIAPLISHPIDNSFPSGHALFTGALIVGLCRYFRSRWLIAVTVLIGLITLVARVVGGVHYPGDIIGGLFFGIVGAYFLGSLVEKGVQKILPICLKVASWIGL